MFAYINSELPALVQQHFHISSKRQSITGFSMGGLGALNSALKNPGKFSSVSAFAPMSNMMLSEWAKIAYPKLFGSIEAGKDYDPTQLIAKYEGPKIPMLVDQGANDKFLKEFLLTGDFIAACHKSNYPVEYRLRDGYDHSFFYVSSFIEEHFEFHARALFAPCYNL